jgi:hypothetical protein
MVLKLVRYLSLLLVALTLGLTFAHVMEIPGKLRLGGADWLMVQHNLYVGFGTVGAAIEVLAMALTWLLVLMMRRRRPALWWTLAAAVCVSAGLADWFLLVAPMNAALSVWRAETLPADWTRYRDQWELGHAIHAGFFMLGFSALVLALLAETSDRPT